MEKEIEKATFAGGCFWCSEAIFKKLKGVTKVISGYAGGEKENPTYEEVSSQGTNHAEAVQIFFDPKKISYEDLLYVFLKTHDPTTLDRQGADVGHQYRSEIFYHSGKQKNLAEKAIAEVQKEYQDKIVTALSPFTNFYKAETHHQDYYQKHKNAPYCKLVIDPKIKKLEENFGEFLK